MCARGICVGNAGFTTLGPMEQAAWLDTTIEETLEPELEICDPHHHLWVHETNNYLLDELRADTGAGHNVTSTVFVCG